mmetsp:Transcript_62274/g.142566  ORF Transcript_62274/g.142566 Transcript_62274/m.142566 type:complete len:593 (+) Transcript_62274:2-1780(+)
MRAKMARSGIALLWGLLAMVAAPVLGFMGSPGLLGLRGKRGTGYQIGIGGGTRVAGFSFDDGLRKQGWHAPAALFAKRKGADETEDLGKSGSTSSSLDSTLREFSDDDEEVLWGEEEAYLSQDGTTVQNEDGDGTKTLLTRLDGERVVKLTTSGFYTIDMELFKQPGTESDSSTWITAVKVIIGGVAPLLMPWCIMNQGLIGGPLTVLGVGILSAYTVRLLVDYKDAVAADLNREDLTYVDVATHGYGQLGGRVVFVMTLINSLGICAAYSAFIGGTMADLSAAPGSVLPMLSSAKWQLVASAIILPLNAFSSNPRFLSLVAALGAGAIAVSVGTVCICGFIANPLFLNNLFTLPLFTTPDLYFQSFGVIPLLFCVHFAILPVERAMRNRGSFPTVLRNATWACIATNAAFGLFGFLFFGMETSSIVLDNLGSGGLLSVVKISLVFDMIVSYPVMLASSREIVENAVLGVAKLEGRPNEEGEKVALQYLVRAGLIAAAVSIAQVGDVGKICNLVGGVCQCALAFIIPPALSLHGAKLWGRPGTAAGSELPGLPGPAMSGKNWDISLRERYSDYAVMTFGAMASVATLYASTH